MVAEYNKEVKKKRNGKGVNRIDEGKLHDSPECFGVWGLPVREPMNLYAFALCAAAVYCRGPGVPNALLAPHFQ
jgi:hypothetical protein